ncbi:MAG: hypothetical protein Q8N28_02375 [bacterium]|nr:hypothetical protein [bacterium]
MKNLLNFNKPKNAVQWLIFLAAIGITLSSPYGTRTFWRELNKYLEKKSEKEKISFPQGKISQTIYYLKKQKIISFAEENGKIALTLTEKGKRRKLEYDLNNIVIPKPNVWDRRWRLLMFDIPESYKFARNALRWKLKNLGFIQFQKSVWIYPYHCENEIDFLTEHFSIARFINLLTVQIENDKPLREHFNLQHL